MSEENISIIDFYFYDLPVNGMLFKDVLAKDQDYFNDLPLDKFIPWIYPKDDQDNPKFTEEDDAKLHRYAGTASSEARLFLRKFLEKYGIILLETNIIKMKNDNWKSNVNYITEVINRASNFIHIHTRNRSAIRLINNLLVQLHECMPDVAVSDENSENEKFDDDEENPLLERSIRKASYYLGLEENDEKLGFNNDDNNNNKDKISPTRALQKRNLKKSINKADDDKVTISDFLGNSKSVNNYMFINISKMDQDKFNEFPLDEYMVWLYPNGTQDNPMLTENDIKFIRSNKYTISVLSNNIFDLILNKYDLNYNNRRKEVTSESKKWEDNKEYLIETIKRVINFYRIMNDNNNLKKSEIVLDYVENHINNEENLFDDDNNDVNEVNEENLPDNVIIKKTEQLNVDESAAPTENNNENVETAKEESNNNNNSEENPVKEESEVVKAEEVQNSEELPEEERNEENSTTETAEEVNNDNEIVKEEEEEEESNESPAVIQSEDNNYAESKPNEVVEEGDVTVSQFLGNEKSVNNNKYKEISVMDQDTFNSFPLENYINWLYPNENQTNPTVTDEDIKFIQREKTQIGETSRLILDLILKKNDLKYSNRKKEVTEDSPKWRDNKDNLIEIMKRVISFYDMMGDKNRMKGAEIILKYLQNNSNSNNISSPPPPPPSSSSGNDSELVKADEMTNAEEVPSAEEKPATKEENEVVEAQEVVNEEEAPKREEAIHSDESAPVVKEEEEESETVKEQNQETVNQENPRKDEVVNDDNSESVPVEEAEIKKVSVITENSESTPSPNISPAQKQENSPIKVEKEESITKFLSNITPVNGILFVTITKMNNDKFENINIDDFMKWIFPSKNQSEPELKDSDIKYIKDKKYDLGIMTFNIFNLIIEKYGLKYIERKKEVKEINKSYKDEPNKGKILELLNQMKEYYETVMVDRNRKTACELVIEYIQKGGGGDSNTTIVSSPTRNSDLPPIKPPSPSKSSTNKQQQQQQQQNNSKTPSRITHNNNNSSESVKVDTSEEMLTPAKNITERRKKSIFTPPKKLEKPLDENFHEICRFYSGNEEYNGYLINDYLEMNNCKLIREVMKNLHYFFPLIGETIEGVQFKEKDKYIFVSTLVIRQNFNRFMDYILVGLGIRELEENNSLKWVNNSQIYPSYELKKIVKRMRECLLQLFDKWVVYIENLNTIIKDNNIEKELKDENNNNEEENGGHDIQFNNDLNQTIQMKNSIYYDRLHPILAFYSGSISYDKYILDYFKLKQNVLIDEIIKEKSFFYPTLNNEEISPEFEENEVNTMREELIIRQHYNELFDCVLCGLKIREKVKGSSHYIWNDFDKLRFDEDEKDLIRQMKESVELIYPKWKIYIEALEKVIARFNAVIFKENSKKIFDKEYIPPVKPTTTSTPVKPKSEEQEEVKPTSEIEEVKPDSTESKPTTTTTEEEVKPTEYPVVTATYISDDKPDNEAEFKKMIQPVRKSTIHYEDNIHPTLKFYSCNYNSDKDDENLNIEKYFELSGDELLTKMIGKIEIIFPFVNEGNPVFLNSDKEKLTDDIIMRQNYNRLVDNVLVEMGIRGKRKSSQLKWSKSDLSNMSDKVITILKRMRKSIEDIFPSWIIYLNVLNKLLEN